MVDPRYDAMLASLGRELEIELVDRTTIEVIHEELIARYGGIQGIRDPHGLEAALARPLQLNAYEGNPSVAQLAAVLSAGIIQNHPFVDGNKRTGFQALFVFLAINGYDLNADPSDALNTIRDIASGAMGEEAFATWIARNSRSMKNEQNPFPSP